MPDAPDNLHPKRRMMVGTRTTVSDWIWLDELMGEKEEAPARRARRMPLGGGRQRGGKGRGLGGDKALSQQTQGGASSSNAPHVFDGSVLGVVKKISSGFPCDSGRSPNELTHGPTLVVKEMGVVLCVPMNTTNPNYEWLSRKPRSHTLSRGRVGGINPVPADAPPPPRGRAVVAVLIITKWGGADAPSGSCVRATNGKLPHQERRARARHAKVAAVRSVLIWAFGVLSILLTFLVLLSFPWALSLHFGPEIH
ncbi:hypothetical protein PIB30_085145 [Stylosanthes scabra]|uniref:Uncharacterized protein n=1 Tax=Stylosanthes scabra TaxID=79078 RepID=A0ABU6RTJ9_9FABA|nr:hypothetical protein [Stylosanthes scabra]